MAVEKPEAEIKGVGLLLDSRELAAVLGVSAKTVSRMQRARLIPYLKLPGGEVRFRPEDVKNFINRMVVLEKEK